MFILAVAAAQSISRQSFKGLVFDTNKTCRYKTLTRQHQGHRVQIGKYTSHCCIRVSGKGEYYINNGAITLRWELQNYINVNISTQLQREVKLST